MPLTHLECTRCGRGYEPGRLINLCECGGPLFARYDLVAAAKEMRPGHLALREPSLWRYHDVLPVSDPEDRVTLGEGFTPLLPVPSLGARAGLSVPFGKRLTGQIYSSNPSRFPVRRSLHFRIVRT